MAWPGIIHDIEDDATAGICEDYDNLQYNYDQLRKQLDDTRKDLDLEKDRSAHLKSELKKYQSSRSDAPCPVSKPRLTTTPPTVPPSHTALNQPPAVSLRMTLDQPPVASSSQVMLEKTPKRSFGKRKMIGTDEIIDLDMLPEAQAASIATLSGPVSQYQLDMFAPVDDGEAFIQDLHDEVLEDAREAEERVAAKWAPKCKCLNECLAGKGANEIAPYADRIMRSCREMIASSQQETPVSLNWALT